MHANRALLLILISTLVLAPALARGEAEETGESKIMHLYLTPSDDIEPDGYGMIKCDMQGKQLSFKAKAQGLTAGVYYGLFSGGELLGVDFSKGGDVHFEGGRDSSLLASSFELWVVEFSGDGVYKKERVLRTETFVH